MELKEKTILVAWDFSNVAEYALQHAIRFAEKIDDSSETCRVVKGVEGHSEYTH